MAFNPYIGSCAIWQSRLMVLNPFERHPGSGYCFIKSFVKNPLDGGESKALQLKKKGV